MSSKYKDIISKSTQMSSGCPAIYKLKPREETIGNMTKLSIGDKNLKKTNKTLLLVGETGAGKSTLINALFNYTLGVKFEDGVWFQVIEEEESQTESQTADVIVYEMCEGQSVPYSLTVIDTPGYGCTGGIEHDVIVSERLLDLFRSEDGVHELHAVGLVLKASVNRLDERMRYIFDNVLSLFGKNLEKNIVALITHSDGTRPKNALKALEAAKIKCAKNVKNEPMYFLYNNCQSDDRTDEGEKVKLKQSFDKANEGMSQLEQFIGGAQAQNLDATLEVLNTRICLAACIQNLQERISLIDLKKREIKQTEEGLKNYEEKLGREEDYTIEVEEVYKEKKMAGSGYWLFGLFYDAVTSCTVCEENCHYPCTIAKFPAKCEVMKNGNCTVCTKNCHESNHVKDNFRYVSKTRKVKKTLEDVKKKYEIEKKERSESLTAFKQVMDELEKEEEKFVKEAYQHVMKLELIALNGISLSTAVHLDVLIEKMKEKGEKEKVQKLEMINNRQGKGVISVIKRYLSSRFDHS